MIVQAIPDDDAPDPAGQKSQPRSYDLFDAL